MGADMGTIDALVTAFMGWAVVFLGICLLIIVVMLVGKVMKRTAPAPAPATATVTPMPEAPRAPEAPGTAGDLMLYNTPDRDAAMIMAIVADELHIPINELRFISIKEVHKK